MYSRQPTRERVGAARLLLWAGAAVAFVGGCDGLVAKDIQGLTLRKSVRSAGVAEDGRRLVGQGRRWDATTGGMQLQKHLEPLRGGAGKKLGGKNLGLVMVALGILFTPTAMSSCSARMAYQGAKKLQRMGCGPWFMLNNVVTLTGLALVLVNSRKFDRYGRSKFKMRLTGSVIIFMGMMLIIAHAGLMLEWWGFASLFYNFTPKFMAQIPREMSKLFNKGLEKTGMAQPSVPAWTDPSQQQEQQREIDRLNRWTQAQSDVHEPPPPPEGA